MLLYLSALARSIVHFMKMVINFVLSESLFSVFWFLLAFFFFLNLFLFLGRDLTLKKRYCNGMLHCEHAKEMKNAVLSVKTSKHQSSLWNFLFVVSTAISYSQSCWKLFTNFFGSSKKNNENKFKWISSSFHCVLTFVCIQPCHQHNANQMHYFFVVVGFIKSNWERAQPDADAGLQASNARWAKPRTAFTIYIL